MKDKLLVEYSDGDVVVYHDIRGLDVTDEFVRFINDVNDQRRDYLIPLMAVKVMTVVEEDDNE